MNGFASTDRALAGFSKSFTFDVDKTTLYAFCWPDSKMSPGSMEGRADML